MSPIDINKFFFDQGDILPNVLKKENEELFNLISNFKEYVDLYHGKLEVIYNLLKSLDNSFDLQPFERDLKRLNQLLMGGAKSEDDFERHQDELFARVEVKEAEPESDTLAIRQKLAALKEIIKYVVRYAIKQEKYLKKYNTETIFKQHIDEFMSCVNEEASVLFCYRVKDSFEFMDAPGKKILAQLNRDIIRFVKDICPIDENLSLLKKKAASIIGSSSSTSGLFRDIIHILKQTTDVRCIQLFVVAPDSKKIEVKLYTYVDHLPMYDVAHEEGIIAEAVKGKKVVCVNSVYEEPRYDIFDATIKSELALPILINKDVYGVLNFEDNHFNRFSDEFVYTIQEICSLISGKLNSLRDIYSLKKERII